VKCLSLWNLSKQFEDGALRKTLSVAIPNGPRLSYEAIGERISAVIPAARVLLLCDARSRGTALSLKSLGLVKTSRVSSFNLETSRAVCVA